MRIVIQRVLNSSVEVESKQVASIQRGLMLLVGFGQDDTAECLQAMAEKVVNMRIFPNEEGRFHFSVKDIAGEILAVPQFTLYADTSKGRRPEFFAALKPEAATKLFDEFCDCLSKTLDRPVERGIFGANMKVNLLNDGPVTIILD
jgi:D-tyrosyl-tRNA(Tyr) deacylase